MKNAFAALLLLLVSSPLHAQRMNSLRPPPAGYTWFTPSNAGAAVLRPDGWFTKSESKNDTDSLFVSKEDIDAAGEFRTGLSLNFVHGVKAKTGLSPAQYAYTFLSKALDGNEELKAFGGPSDGMVSIGLRIRNKRLGKVIHYYLVANDAGDTLHIFMYEAPAEEWEAAWKTGEPIFRNLVLVFPKLRP